VQDSGFQAKHLYLLLAMAGATWAVIVSPHTHPAALVLLSAAILAVGFVGSALHQALAGFLSGHAAPPPPALSVRDRAALETEKALVLRSLKELEFDRAMGKISEADFTDIGSRLRGKAVAIMEDLERAAKVQPVVSHAEAATAPVASGTRTLPPAAGGSATTSATICPSCGSASDVDAKFCKDCGSRLS
jgi:hypothetical protein